MASSRAEESDVISSSHLLVRSQCGNRAASVGVRQSNPNRRYDGFS